MMICCAASCGTDDDRQSSSADTVDVSLSVPECDYSDGETITREQMSQGCTLDGTLAVFLGYDDCEDGSELYVTGDRETDLGSGWILFPPGSDEGIWTGGAWGDAWLNCYGY